MGLRMTSSSETKQLTRWQKRLSIVAMYAGYPLGCVLLGIYNAPGFSFGEAAGFGFMVITLIGFATMTVGTNYWRLGNAPSKELDEREVAERNTAYQLAYSFFASIVALGVIYVALATDMNEAKDLSLWVPDTYDEWNAMIWGVLLYGLTLPVSILAWREKQDDE